MELTETAMTIFSGKLSIVLIRSFSVLILIQLYCNNYTACTLYIVAVMLLLLGSSCGVVSAQIPGGFNCEFMWN